MAAYGRLETWALQRGVIVPLASGKLSYLTRPEVESLQVTPVGVMPDNNNWSTVNAG
jgi:hypothetical protein